MEMMSEPEEETVVRSTANNDDEFDTLMNSELIIIIISGVCIIIGILSVIWMLTYCFMKEDDKNQENLDKDFSNIKTQQKQMKKPIHYRLDDT